MAHFPQDCDPLPPGLRQPANAEAYFRSRTLEAGWSEATGGPDLLFNEFFQPRSQALVREWAVRKLPAA